MKSKFFFTAGIVGMLAGVAFGATDGADKGWFSEYRPYMTLRGGWLFGKAKPGISVPGVLEESVSKSSKSAWSGSIEFGTAHFGDRLLCGVELGYFTGEFKLNEPFEGGIKLFWSGDIENFFAVGNVALLRDFGEKTFWYGGVGGGLVRRYCKIKSKLSIPGNPDVSLDPVMWKWSFLGQAFTGVGVYLNDDWQLTAGYRLRWMPGSFEIGGDIFALKVKQPVVHAVEIGIVRRF